MPDSKTKRNIISNKGENTDFQILLEVMRSQPHVRQKDIADAVGITIQAVSKHFKKLVRDGMLAPGSERADYRVTSKATNKMDDYLRNLSLYTDRIKRELKIDRLLPALATCSIRQGELAGIIMREGVIYAVNLDQPGVGAYGIAAQDASPGEDVGLREVKGEVKKPQGRVVMVRLPSMNEGGSRAVDLEKVMQFYNEFSPDRVGVVGVVGRAVLNKLGLRADLDFGITRATALAAERGLKVFVLVVGRMVNRVIEEIDASNMKHFSKVIYEVKEGRLTAA